MLAATPVRKPIITECDTNRTYRPRRRIEATTIRAPANSVSSRRAALRSWAGTPASTEPAAKAAALVVVTTIRRVLEKRPPAIGPTRLAYNPWIGLTPASTLAAMPSGTLPMAPGTPATASERRVRASTRLAAHQARRSRGGRRTGRSWRGVVGRAVRA